MQKTMAQHMAEVEELAKIMKDWKNLEDETISFAEDLIPLGDVLEKHLHAEAKSMGLANVAIIKSKDFFTNFIVSYLMADEIKHHEMLTKLDQVKGYVHPAGVLRGETETGRLP